MQATTNDKLLTVNDLSVQFIDREGTVQAVDGMSFDVGRSETLGIVGESGCGKTVTVLAVLGILPKSAKATGSVSFQGEQLLGRSEEELRELRGKHISIIFQDALTAMNPAYTVGWQIAEAIRVHEKVPKAQLRSRAAELLDLVGIPNAAQSVKQYPHEFSGGMRQRAMIAMAIANDPDLIIADEPTTALDVTIQAQVLDVLDRIQERTNSSLILITHDLGVVAGLADRVLVMYAGRPVEQGTIDEVFYKPSHPYTLGLLACLPRLDEADRKQRLYQIPGQPPLLTVPAPGCSYAPRCPFAKRPDPCDTLSPEFRAVAQEHRAACHFAEEVATVRPSDLRQRA